MSVKTNPIPIFIYCVFGADSDGGAELSALSFSPRWKEIGRFPLPFRRLIVSLHTRKGVKYARRSDDIYVYYSLTIY